MKLLLSLNTQRNNCPGDFSIQLIPKHCGYSLDVQHGLDVKMLKRVVPILILMFGFPISRGGSSNM